jgi:hypothetical protein
LRICRKRRRKLRLRYSTVSRESRERAGFQGIPCNPMQSRTPASPTRRRALIVVAFSRARPTSQANRGLAQGAGLGNEGVHVREKLVGPVFETGPSRRSSCSGSHPRRSNRLSACTKGSQPAGSVSDRTAAAQPSNSMPALPGEIVIGPPGGMVNVSCFWLTASRAA